MNVVIPFYAADEHLALKNLEIARQLDGKVKHRAVIAVDKSTRSDAVANAAALAFEKVEVIRYAVCPYGRDGFKGSNWAWQMTARWMFYHGEKQPWFWWEPDAVQIKAGCMDALEAAYVAGKKPLAGWIEKNRYMVGVGIYSHDVSQWAYRAMNCTTSPWDITLGMYDRGLEKTADIKELLVHKFHDNGDGDRFYSFADVRRSVPESAVIFHRCDDGTLHDIMEEWSKHPVYEQANEELIETRDHTKTFFHSGDLGDIIYSLPAIRGLGGGTLFLGPHKPSPPFLCRERMDKKRAGLIIPLLKEQPYIHDVVFIDRQQKVDHDLNQFRLLIYGASMDGHKCWTLSSLVLKAFSLPASLELTPWIDVKPLSHAPDVIFSRSQRYHNPDFSWVRVYREYGKDAGFIGTKQEYDIFCSEIGQVPFIKTSDLLEVARYIAGSKLFVGNQSCPFAIAEAMKHPAILEWNVNSQNCHFNRRTLIYGVELNTPLPSILRKQRINWCTLYDSISGIGRSSMQFVRRIKGVELNVVPTRTDDSAIKQPDLVRISGKRVSGPSVVFESLPEMHRFLKKGDIAFTMWETSLLPQNAVETLNKSSMVIVTSDWCASTFKESGVTPPIVIVPLGIDQELFKPSAHNGSSTMRFGAAARFCRDGNPRKNLDFIVNNFRDAFNGVKDVSLTIKGYDGCPEQVDDSRIKIISDFWPEHRLVSWYQSLDVFINLASGGGWELHLQEAMACGAVPVAMLYSSSTMFFSEDNGYVVGHRLVAPNWGAYDGIGLWAEPNAHSFQAILKKCYADRTTLAEKRLKAIQSAQKFTWDSASRKMETILLNAIC